MKNLSKIVLSCLILGLSVSIAHARVVVGVGMNYGPGYAPPPCYYGPPCYPQQQVAWVPGHWECGYWVTGHYIQYAAPAPVYVQPTYYGPSYGYSYTTTWGHGGCHGGGYRCHHGHHGRCR